MIELRDIKKIYRMGDTEVHALAGVSLTIEDGDFVAIMGPSGSGKSTLMHVLGLLDVPTTGQYLIDGKEISQIGEDDLAVLRRNTIGFIFQQFNLLARMTAVENVSLPQLYSRQKMDLKWGGELLERVGLGTRLDHRPNQLSGGQQQRVAIARSLVNKPLMVLADEPTGNLDSVSEVEILRILKELNDDGITIVVVTHEEEVGQQAKRLVRMRDGKVQSDERRAPKSVPTSRSLADEAVRKNPYREVLEYFYQGFRTLLANKVRTALSMLGILIGVAAVVAMLAIGRGAQKDIEASLSSLGSNLLVLRSGAIRRGGVAQESGSTTRLTLEDAEKIEEQVANIKGLAPAVQGRAQVAFGNKNWSTQVIGTTGAYEKIRAYTPVVGRFFSDEDNQRRNRVVLVGATIVREIFGGQDPVGEMMKINKVSFQVVGVLPEKGSGGFRDQDDTVVIPLLTAMYRVLGKTYVDSIDIEIETPEAMEQAQEEILELINARHRVPPSQQQQAFEVRNMADIQAALTDTSKTLALLLAAIAAISLVVGGIGIMNIMLVSVTERTKEIGLRKAIGARKRDILLQFLAESVVVSVIGGIAGILLGWGVTVAVSLIAGWATSISAGSVFLAFFFSATIGVVFGIYPAKKASELHPIQALRYE